MSFKAKVLLVDALESERLQLRVNVGFLILLFLKLKFWIHFIKLNWSLRLGFLHCPSNLACLIFHSRASLVWKVCLAICTVRGSVEGVLAATIHLLTTLARKWVWTLWAFASTVHINDLVIARSTYRRLPVLSSFSSWCVTSWLLRFFSVAIFANLKPLNLFNRYRKDRRILIEVHFLCLRIAHLLRLLTFNVDVFVTFISSSQWL